MLELKQPRMEVLLFSQTTVIYTDVGSTVVYYSCKTHRLHKYHMCVNDALKYPCETPLLCMYDVTVSA